MSSTGITGIGFFLAAFLVGTTLTIDDQSKYFMIISLVALQSAFDLGASQLLMTNLAYRHRSLMGLQNLSTDVSSVLQVALRYAAICTCIYVPFFLGAYLLALKFSSLTLIEGGFLALGSGASMFATFLFSFFEGLGYVQKAYAMRFLMNVSRTFILIAGLFFGAGIYAVTISMLISSALSLLVILISFDCRKLWRLAVGRSMSQSSYDFTWRVNILPKQWRLSISWISAYVIYQGPIWLSFATLQTEDSARFGLTWNIFIGLSALGAAILTPHAAAISNLLGLQSIDKAVQLWRRKSTALLLFALFTGGGVIFLVSIVPQNWSLSERILPITELWWLLAATMANQVIYCFVIFGRASGNEPFHFNYVIWVIMTLLLFVLLGDIHNSSLIIIMSYTFSCWVMVPLFYKVNNDANSS